MNITASRQAFTGIKSYDDALAAFYRLGGQLNEKTIFEYLKNIATTCKAETLRHKVKAFKRVLMQAATEKGADSSYFKFMVDQKFSELKAVKADETVQEGDILTPDELKAIVKTADARTALIVEALYQTAARVSELLAIRLTDCKEKRGKVEIEIIGKGRRARRVQISADLFARIKSTFASKQYLFETRTGSSLNRSNVFRMVKSAGELIGVENLHPHTLRHSWATHNIDGLGVYKVSRYLGHSDTAVTSRYYLHSTPNGDEIETSWRALA